MNEVEIRWLDDEAFEVWCNGTLIITANHDDEGYAGMVAVKLTVIELCAVLNVDYKEND